MLVDIHKTVIAVARQQFDAEKRVPANFLLPSRAAGGETRLPQSVRGKHKLADRRTANRHSAGWVEKNIDLLLIERLLNYGEIQRSIVDAPSE